MNKEQLMARVQGAIDSLVGSETCGLEEAIERLKELKSDIDLQIQALRDDIRNREKDE